MAIQKHLLFLAGILGFLGVLAGTFGAHGLKGHIDPAMLETFMTGVDYHLVHALALLALALSGLAERSCAARVSACAFILGIATFSGALYLLAFTGEKKLGMIAPLGGTAFMVGWIALAVAGWRGK